MPSSSVQPEYVVRSSNAAVGGSNEKQDQMLSLNAVSLNNNVISGRKGKLLWFGHAQGFMDLLGMRGLHPAPPLQKNILSSPSVGSTVILLL